jgi:hypothetical protein
VQIRFGETDYGYKDFPSPRVPCRKSKQGDLGAVKWAVQTVSCARLAETELSWGQVATCDAPLRRHTSQQ